MKYNYPKKYHELIQSIALSFDPFGAIDDEQLLLLIEAVEAVISERGMNEAGDGESKTGTLCADLLAWLAGHE